MFMLNLKLLVFKIKMVVCINMNKDEKDIQKLIERKKLESAALKKILKSIHSENEGEKREKSGEIKNVADSIPKSQ